jgi:signal peptidase I
MSEQPREFPLSAVFFSFRGRLNRSRYWEYSILANAAFGVLFFIIGVLFFQIADSTRATGGDSRPAVFVIVSVLAFFVVLWTGLALQVKRLHDRGRSGWFSLLNLVPILGSLWLTIDTYFLPGNTDANRYGVPPKLTPRSTRAEIGVVLAGIGVLLAILFVGRTFIAEPFIVPSGSNEPTIANGDNIFVSRYTYRLHDPARGDLAVFINPHTGEDYIKRIVGLPGDTIQLSRGVISINGQPVQRTRIADYHERTWLEMYRRYDDIVRYRYAESIPGSQPHEILGNEIRLSEDSMPQDNTGIFKVPPGHFFAVGDNRDNSNDSRFQLGYVPLTNLVGRVEFCHFSRAPDTPGWTVLLNPFAGARWDRMFKVLL